MEVERDVEIQIIEGEKDPKGSLKAGFSTGPHASGHLPAYSETERTKGLGSSAVDRIRSVLRASGRGGQAQRAGARGSTRRVIPLRNGW